MGFSVYFLGRADDLVLLGIAPLSQTTVPAGRLHATGPGPEG